MRCVMLRLENQRFALPLADVREVVIPEGEWACVPKAPPYVRGVFNLRGKVVLVADLVSLLMQKTHCEAPFRVVVLERGKCDMAVSVSDVEGMEEVTVSPVATSAASNSDPIKGMCRETEVPVLSGEMLETWIQRGFVSNSIPTSMRGDI